MFIHFTCYVGNGVCSQANKCVCNAGFHGLNCENKNCTIGFANNSTGDCVPICFDEFAANRVCSNGGGVCSDVNVCRCFANRIGLQCEQCATGYAGSTCAPVCFGIEATNTSAVCNGHGKCNSPNVCNCDDTYRGAQCELRTCLPKYTQIGLECVPTCFGILGTNASKKIHSQR